MRVPHDLVHLVVESAFGLADGFWGRVDAAVDPARAMAEAIRRGGAALVLAALTARWRGLGPKGALDLVFHRDAPARAFAGMGLTPPRC